MTKTFPFLSTRLLLALPLAGLLAHPVQAQTAATFGPLVQYSPGTSDSPSRPSLADVTGDGQLDIVFVTYSATTPSIRVLPGSGNGTFQAPIVTAIAANQFGTFALADVTGDGKLDIALSNNTYSTLTVLLGNGNGTFGTATAFSTGAGSRPGVITAADINADGKADLLTIDNFNSEVRVLLNSGTGTFGPAATYSTGTNTSPSDLAVADVNKDGKADLLVSNFGTSEVGVFLGTGSGAFGAIATYLVKPTLNSTSSPASLQVADVNGDGNLDALTANVFGNAVAVLLGNGNGTFGTVTAYTTGTGSGNVGFSYPNQLVVSDVNGDGRPDLLTANSGTSSVGVLVGNGDGTFQPFFLYSTAGAPGNIAAADVNNDSRPDLIISPTLFNTIGVALNTSGSFANLVVNTTTTIAAGTYNNITINSPGVATLAGPVQVNGVLTVNNGGTLYDGCNIIRGQGNFAVAAGGTLGICNPAGITSSGATGAVQVAGARSFSRDASYLYNGTTYQSTGNGLPGQVRNLTTTNANTLNLDVYTSVTQALTIGGAGNLTGYYYIDNHYFVSLLSSAAGTALLVNSGTGTVGATVVQRYIDPGKNSGSGYRHFASPVRSTTVADIANNYNSSSTPVTPFVVNPAYNTSATPPLTFPFPTVFGYDQALVNRTNSSPAFDKGFFSPASLSDPLVPGRGYAVQSGAGQFVDFLGVPNQGTVTVAASRNAAGTLNDQAAGWQFLGNPYPSPLDLSRLTSADYPGFDAAAYVQESTGPYTGMYRTYVNGIGNPLLASCQGFFMRVSTPGTSTTFTFRNAQRVTSFDRQAAFYRTAADPRPLVQLALNAPNGEADTFFAYAESGASAAFDASFDAAKLPNANGLNLSSTAASGESCSIDGRPAFAAATVLPLAMGVPAAGTYSLGAAELRNLPAGLSAYLTDAQTGQVVPLSAGSSYSFGVSAAEAQGVISGRFSLVFRPATALAAAPSLRAAEVAVYPNPTHADFTVVVPAVAGAATVQAELCNALGQVLRRQAAALPATGATLRVLTGGLAAGVYVLRLQAGEATIARRVVVQ